MNKKLLVIVLILIICVSLIYTYIYTTSRNPARETITHNTITKTITNPVSAKEYSELLGVGINVDWLTYSRVMKYYFYWRSKGVNIPEYFKERGFSNVRIRVDGDIVKNKTYLELLGEVVDDCLKAGIIPVIAYGAPDLRNNPDDPSAVKHFIEWWVTATKYFKGKSYLISFDLLIETSGPIKNYVEKLNQIYNETIEAIRKIDKYRIIIVTAPHCSSPFYLKYLKLPKDPYILTEWHIYAKGPCPKRRIPCNYTAEEIVFNKTLIDKAVETASKWSEETGIPTWMGAWKPNCYPKHCKEHLLDGAPKPVYPVEKALVFVKYMVNSLKKHHIPYDINADQLFFNIEKLYWYPSQKPILDTVIGKETQNV